MSQQETVKYKHPFLNNGTSQQNRNNKYLQPKYVELNNWNTADYLRFAYEFSANLNYYNEENLPQGDWSDFFSQGPVNMLAIISSVDQDAFLHKYNEAEVNFWRKYKKGARGKEIERAYQELIDRIYEIADKIRQLCEDIPQAMPLKREILEIIKNQVARSVLNNQLDINALEVLIAYDKANDPDPDVKNRNSGTSESRYEKFIQYDKPARDKDGKVVDETNRKSTICRMAWGINGSYAYDCITPDIGYKDPINAGKNEPSCRENINLRNLFLIFYQALAKIIQRAKIFLNKELAESHQVQPHLSLYISFIQLFKQLQARYQDFSRVHLNYYYQEILGLKTKRLEPDQAYVLFRLAKSASETLLEKGTLVDAGRDAEGKPRAYALDKEIVVNKSEVATFLMDTEGKSIIETPALVLESQSPLASTPSPSRFIWKSGVHRDVITNGGRRLSSNFKYGFAISHPVLNLKEGERRITIRLIAQGLPQREELQSVKERIQVDLSTSENKSGWHTLVQNRIEISEIKQNEEETDLPGSTPVGMVLTLSLRQDDYPLDLPEKPEDPFLIQCDKPVVKILFSNELYQDFSETIITNVEITVEVEGLENSIKVRNELGEFDNRNAFPGFGVEPTEGSYMQISSDEWTGKKLTEVLPKAIFLGNVADDVDESDEVDAATLLIDTKQFKIRHKVNKKFNEVVIEEDKGGYVRIQEDPYYRLNPEIDQVLGELKKDDCEKEDINSPEFFDKLSIFVSKIGGGISKIFERIFRKRKQEQKARAFMASPSMGEFMVQSLGTARFVNEVDVLMLKGAKASRIRKFFLRVRGEKEKVVERDDSFIKKVIVDYKAEASWKEAFNIPETKVPTEGEVARNVEKPGLKLVVIDPELKLASFHQQGFTHINHFPDKDEKALVCLPLFIPTAITLPSGEDFSQNDDEVETPDDNEIGIKGEFPNPFEQSNIYIGLDNFVPGQSLSLLFQLEDGGGDAEFDPPEVRWFYLEKDEDGIEDIWREFRSQDIIEDMTKPASRSETSLLQTGIIRFKTPLSMTNSGTSVMPGSGYYWVRAVMPSGYEVGKEGISLQNPLGQLAINQPTRVDALPPVVAIHAQAALAVFHNKNNSLEHLDRGLPADSIQKLVNFKPSIKEVNQPYPSFGGKKPEDEPAFYRRVSERLRHKDRAVSCWDFERLIMEKFSDIRHAKCIPHTSKSSFVKPELSPGEDSPGKMPGKPKGIEKIVPKPGRVMLAVFPKPQNRSAFNPLTPGFGIGKLEEMESYLQSKANLFLRDGRGITVVNPSYEMVKVHCRVRFFRDKSPLFYAGQLNEALKKFLAPWAYDEEEEILFSGSVSQSLVLNHIEELPYVDKILDFKLSHYLLNRDLDIYETYVDSVEHSLEATTPRSVFTTYLLQANDNTTRDHDISWDGAKNASPDDTIVSSEFTAF
ncbi:MAG: hypothetical protein MRZ79_21750 [Bacteroidia bacterium]|nr:hypothetical protein [Bacteroidia bacterium]